MRKTLYTVILSILLVMPVQAGEWSLDVKGGIIPELEMGVGLVYQWAYLELDYFQGTNFGGQNLPISTQQVVMFAGVNIPLTGWGQ